MKRRHASSAVAPTPSVVKPGGHLLQVEPSEWENVPLRHGWHPSGITNDPGGHMHEPMPKLLGGESVPGGHGWHAEKS